MFGKTKEALLRAEFRAEQLTSERDRLARDLEQLKELSVQATERINELLNETNTLQLRISLGQDQMKDLNEQVHKLDKDKAVLMERLDLVAQGLVAPAEKTPHPFERGHVPEEVEDAEYMLRHGRINRSEFEKVLEESGFSNTEIEIEEFTPSDYPRLGS